MSLNSYIQNMFSTRGNNNQKMIFDHGNGAYIYDIEGKEYIDFCNGFGSILLGYNDADINASVSNMLNTASLSLKSPTRDFVEFSELIFSNYPHHNKIALFSTGTESLRAATLAVKDYTKKEFVISSGYHGWDPMWEFSKVPFEPNSYGIIDFFYIIEKFEELIEQYYNRIAAVIISPDRSYFSESYYKRLRDMCKAYNLLTIIDDVKCGYRYKMGASLSDEIFPAELHVVSKCITNGSGLSCVIGKENVIASMRDYCYTNFYNAYALTLAVATLKKLKKCSVQANVLHFGNKFIEKSRDIILKNRIPISIVGNGNLFQYLFKSQKLAEKFYSESVNKGMVYYEYDNQCPSYAFQDKTCDEALLRFKKVIENLQEFSSESTQIPEELQIATAYNQIDGCLENTSFEQKMNFIKRLYNR